MQFRNKILVRKRLFTRIVTFYVLFLLIISLSPTICLSDVPEITVSSPIDSNNVTSVNYSLISVSISSTESKSSFINWNNSLVGYWNFEQTTGSEINDNSTYTNNAYFENCSITNITDGKYGHGFYFDGSETKNISLECGNDPSLDITNEVTIELSIKESETTFNKTFGNVSGGDAYDRGYCVKQTNDGGYIIVGAVDIENINNPRAGDGNITVVKTNSNGVEEWTKYFGGSSGYSSANYVDQTSDGGYIITGETSNGVDSDLWLIKLDQYGDTDWGPYTWSGAGNDVGNCVQETSVGGYIITGEKRDGADIDVWLIKVDENGAEEGSYIYGESLTDSGSSVLETDEGYIVTGYSVSAGNSDNLWIFKTDYNRNKIGTDVYDNSSEADWGKEIQPTNDGGYIIAGTTYSYSTDQDAWLFKLNESGTSFSRNYTAGGNLGEFGFSGQQTSDGGYILTGKWDSNSEDYGGLLLVKTDPNLNETWKRTFSTLDKAGFFVRQTSDGGYIITGQINRTDIDKDILLIKTDSWGNVTGNYNDQSLNKTLVGKGRDAYQLELRNGTIYGYINGNEVSTSDESLYNLSQYWHHVALTYDGALIKLYVNGTLKASTSCTEPITTNLNDLTIGNNFSGIIDEVRVWNRALNDSEISSSSGCSGTYSRNFTDLADLNYSYYVYAINESGGENQTTTRSVTIDNTTAPSVVSYSPSDTTTDTTPEIIADVFDAGSGVDNSSVIIEVDSVNQTINAYKTFINTTTLRVIYEPSLSLGAHTVSITAQDNYSHVGYYEWPFTVTEGSSGGSPSPPNNAPTAEAGGPYTGQVNTTVIFTGSGTDSDGKIAGYRWDFNNDGTYDTSWATTGSATHTYTTAVTYTAKLQVKDDDDATATDTTTVTITEIPQEDKKPTITNVQHAPKEVTTNDTVTITASVTDDIGITSVTLYWNNGVDYTEMHKTSTGIYTATIVPLTAGITQYWIQATDTKPQTTTSDHYTFTVITVAEIGNISGGQSSNTTSEQLAGTGLSQISVTPNTDQQNVAIKTEVLLELPEEIPDPLSLYQGNGVVFQYYNITITANDTEISELDIESGNISFEITKGWFIENNVSNSSISLYRYYNNIWNPLTTTNLKIQNETHEFYEAETPGFSTFAVVGSKVLEKSQVENPEPSIPWILIIGFIIAAVVILIFVLFKAKLIYVEDVEIKVPEKKEEEKKK